MELASHCFDYIFDSGGVMMMININLMQQHKTFNTLNSKNNGNRGIIKDQ